MGGDDNYDYSAILPVLETFSKWSRDEPFITNMEELYGKLWQFKFVVQSWSLGGNRFENFLYLCYQVKDFGMYVNWNLDKKVSFIEYYQNNFLVIVLEVSDNDS